MIQDKVPLLRRIADTMYGQDDLPETVVVPMAIFNTAQASLPSHVS